MAFLVFGLVYVIFVRVYLVFEMVCLKLIKDGNQGVGRVQRTVFMIIYSEAADKHDCDDLWWLSWSWQWQCQLKTVSDSPLFPSSLLSLIPPQDLQLFVWSLAMKYLPNLTPPWWLTQYMYMSMCLKKICIQNWAVLWCPAFDKDNAKWPEYTCQRRYHRLNTNMNTVQNIIKWLNVTVTIIERKFDSFAIKSWLRCQVARLVQKSLT